MQKKQSVLHVYTSEKIFQDYGKTKDGYFRAMFYYNLYMGYLVADSWNDCEETVKYDWCLECLYEYDTCRAIVEKYGRKFLDVQRDAYLQILKLLQKPESVSSWAANAEPGISELFLKILGRIDYFFSPTYPLLFDFKPERVP
ncbi:MAG: hypothetical protein K6G15_02735, partial [Desulfovibrio sp.]|nr:hypothetical protein [Desulfovibrio sp.]